MSLLQWSAVLIVGAAVATGASAFEVEGDSLGQAAEKFAEAAAVAVERAVKELQEMRRQQSSSIVIPEGMPGGFGGPGGLPGKIKLP